MKTIFLLLLIVTICSFDTNAQLNSTGGPFSKHITSILNYNDTILFVIKDKIGLFKSTNLGSSWHKVQIHNINYDNRNAIVKHKDGDLFLSTTTSGILRSTDLGQTWLTTPTTQFGAARSLFAKSNGALFVGAENAGLYRSHSLGNNWTLLNSSLKVHTMAESTIGVMFITSSSYPGGIFRSVDNGQTWEPQSSSAPPYFLYGDSHNVVYHVGNQNLKKTTNQGDNWIQFGDAPFNRSYSSISVTSDSIIFIGHGRSDFWENGGIRRSNNYGQSFSYYGLNYSTVTHTLLYDDQYLIAANNEGIYKNDFRSSNQFIKIDSGLKEPSVDKFITSFGTWIIVVCDSGGIYRYINNTWQKQYESFPSEARVSTAYFRFFVLIGTKNMGLWRTSDNGVNWNQIILTSTPDVEIFDVKAKDENLIFCATKNQGIYVSTDKGINWRYSSIGLPEAYSVEALEITNQGECFLATTNDGVFYSSDSGYTWVSRSIGLPTVSKVFSFVSYSGSIYSATHSEGIFKSTNSGLNWYKIVNGLPEDLPDPVLGVKSNGHLFIGSDRMIYGSFNSGDFWFVYQPVPVGVKILSLGFDFYGYLYVGCDNGVVYRSNDNLIPVELTSLNASYAENKIHLNWSTATELNNYGFEIERSSDKAEWYTVGFRQGKGTTAEPQNYSFIDDLFGVNSQKLYYRLKQIDFNGTFEYSDIVEVDIAPLSFALDQNYPNPFNPTTVIGYQLPAAGDVTLKVFDVLGREVATLVDEYRDAGYYEVEFSSKIDGKELTSGIYFYRFTIDSFTDTKKMILLR